MYYIMDYRPVTYPGYTYDDRGPEVVSYVISCYMYENPAYFHQFPLAWLHIYISLEILGGPLVSDAEARLNNI
jgi:hypothetical protein